MFFTSSTATAISSGLGSAVALSALRLFWACGIASTATTPGASAQFATASGFAPGTKDER